MNSTRLFFISALLVSTLSSFANAQQEAGAAWQNGLLQNGAYIEGMYGDLFHDSGFRVEENDIKAPFVISENARKVFAANAGLRAKMTVTTPKVFEPIVREIADFIESQEDLRGSSAEKANGLSNWALAIKITRLAFCFSTDPKGVAAQIKVESSFDRSKVSATGAVGFTQMTSIAIDEVNDQLGNRGNLGANPENIPYLESAIRCYMGGRPFAPMFAAGSAGSGSVISKGKLVSSSSRLRDAAKTWLRSDVDRDLIYGQITLKVLLAHAHDQGIVGEAAYRLAFKKYNGEPRGGATRCSRDVMSVMREI